MIKYVTFKGTPSEYTTLHQWVRKQLGTPQECENCGTTEAKRFEWANISGDYLKDISDWARLCKGCHTSFDNSNGGNYGSRVKKLFCINGHPMLEEKVFYKKRANFTERVCRECQRAYHREWKRREAKKLKIEEQS